LQEKGDRLAETLGMETVAGAISTSFVPSMVFPGKERRKKNLLAWNRFWTPARVAAVRGRIGAASRETGFAPDAFEPFFKTLADPPPSHSGIPEQYHSLLGIYRMAGKNSWAQFSILTPGPKYDAEGFNSRISSSGLAKLFDPGFFAERLGSIILTGFMVMALIVGAVTFLVALLYLFDIKLALISMAPTLFSLVCTLGTLKLLGQQAGIPTIIVTVIVIGMGTDYALYLVRASQRYMDQTHPSVGLIRLTIFLSAASTTIGFGVLSLANHVLLKSAGLTLLLGIGYSFAGTVLIVPPLLRWVFVSGRGADRGLEPASTTQTSRVERRYRFMEPYPRLFSRFKMRFDPMFLELTHLLESLHEVRTIIDVGCGYGVPACWFLERFPESKIYGIDPDPNRVRVASMAVGERGIISLGGAPDIPMVPGTADVAIMLDSSHYLKDEDLRLTLHSLHNSLRRGGTLMIRTVIPPVRRFPWTWWLESLKLKAAGIQCYYRSIDEMKTMIIQAEFVIALSAPSGAKGELFWFIAKTGP
jgi:SAM-dependent methyltransferase